MHQALLLGQPFATGYELLLFLKLYSQAARSWVEVTRQVVEEGLYGLALLVPQLALVVGLQALAVEPKHSADLAAQPALEEEFHVFFK